MPVLIHKPIFIEETTIKNGKNIINIKREVDLNKPNVYVIGTQYYFNTKIISIEIINKV